MKKLHIFTRDGATFTFVDVTLEVTNETVIVFRYMAMSDSSEKKATFFTRSIAGWSHTIS